MQKLDDVQPAGTRLHSGEPLLWPPQRRGKGRLGNACGFPNFPQSGNQSPVSRGIDGLGSHDRTEMGDQGIYGTITDYMKFVWNRLI